MLRSLLLVTAGLLVTATPVAAQDCDYSLFHGLDSYFICRDQGSYGGFAWQLTDPLEVNTGSLDLICEAQALPVCVSEASGIAGDGRMDIESNWANVGAMGCPVIAGVGNRIALTVASGTPGGGESLLVSLSGANYDIYYLIEAAHVFDPVQDVGLPLACAPSVEVVDLHPGSMTLHFLPPSIHTDCDPGTLGDTLHVCGATPYAPTLGIGPIYTSVQPCAGPIDLQTEGWLANTISPDANGRVTIIGAPTDDPAECRLVGAPWVIDGVVSPAINAFVSGADCVNRDGDPSWTCARDCDALECGIDCDDNDPNAYPGGPIDCAGGCDVSCTIDNCPGVPNPRQEDADADGKGDVCDNCPSVSNQGQDDADGDGFGNVCDNCPSIANSNQANADGDGFGDLCDGCPTVADSGVDQDFDGFPDACDNCVFIPNANQSDIDFDGIGDVCDNCPAVANPTQGDTDQDGPGNACDNCPNNANPGQADCDQDGFGDVCEACTEPPPGAPDPCGCRPEVIRNITISNGSPAGQGSGTLRWETASERSIIGFNVWDIDSRGRQTRINPAIIPCTQCTSSLGAPYVFIVPKHKNRQGIYVKMLFLGGQSQFFGPAARN